MQTPAAPSRSSNLAAGGDSPVVTSGPLCGFLPFASPSTARRLGQPPQGTAEPDFAHFFLRPCHSSVCPRSHVTGCCVHPCWQGAAAPSLPAGGYGTASAGARARHFSPSTASLRTASRAATHPRQAAEAPRWGRTKAQSPRRTATTRCCGLNSVCCRTRGGCPSS